MIGFILNLPYTLVGLFVALISIPISPITFNRNPMALVIHIKKFWWVFSYLAKARAMAIGHVVLLGPTHEDHDLEHELVHVKQHQHMPLVQPILYQIELMRKGYLNNEYEVEAYALSGSVYRGKEKLG